MDKDTLIDKLLDYIEELKTHNYEEHVIRLDLSNIITSCTDDAYRTGYEDGKADGFEDGYSEGYDEGYDIGLADGSADGFDD